MPTYFQKPENALKRAKEFIDVGKKESALEVLNDVIRSKKHRQWSTTHESIMLLFTHLCVELQRSSFAKDGLYQYRNICKDASLHSFETVVKKFLGRAEDKANVARAESEQTASILQDIEDLDNMQTPESLLLSTVSGEGAKERTDRVVLTPWVKFLWESYRNMLELLKNNHTVERIYADVAKDAFKFCINYQRRTEFRKLCDILRNHLLQAQRYQNQPYSLKFDNPDTIQTLVDVRFEQLECSISVDLWQEAFKAIEEIHNLLGISGKAPKPGLLENFYMKQARVYWMANNRLFHAAAQHKLFVLRKEQKKTLTAEEAQRTASQVLLATLCIDIEPVPSETDRFLEVDDNTRDKARRLANLLRMASPPSRAMLMKDVIRYSILQLLPTELQQLYHLLELEFNPLLLCKKVVPILEGLTDQETLSQYVEPLRRTTLVRLIKQVSQVYQSIELSRLVELAPFATPMQLEKVVVETAHSNNIQIRIDHQTKSLHFGTDVTFSYKDESPEGPHVQTMPSETLCNQLTMMSEALKQAVWIISSNEIQVEQTANLNQVVQDYQQHSRQDHRAALQRKQLIEARKEFIESQSKNKERQEEKERQYRQKQEREAEQERLGREAKEREEESKRQEMAELKRKLAQEKLEALKKTAVGARVFADVTVEDLKGMDADAIMAKQLRQMEKEKKEKDLKLKTQEKKVDYFERAKRLVEIPLLEKQYEEQRVRDRQFHKEQEEERIETEIKTRKEAESASVRLERMTEDKEIFLQHLREANHKKYLEKLAQFEDRLVKERIRLLERRKNERKQRRKMEAAAAKQAEEEKLAKLRREEEMKKEAEEQKQREEQLEAQRLKQLQREKEIEEKLQQRDSERPRQMLEERRKEDYEQEREQEVERGRQGEPENWRQRPPEDEESRNTPRTWERDRYPPSRGTPYRPPVMRERTAEDSWRTKQERDEFDRRGPRDRGDFDWRGPRDRDDFDRRGPRDRDDFDRRGPRDDFYRRGPRDRDDFDRRGPRDDFYRRGPRDRDDFDRRGRDRDDFDRRGPRDRDDFDRRGPRDRDDFDRRGPRDRDDFDRRGPRDRDEFDRRGPRDRDDFDRRGPRDRDDFDRRGPRDRDDFDRRGPRDRDDFDRRGPRDRDDFDRRGPRDRDDFDRRGPRDRDDFDRRGPRDRDDFEFSRGRGYEEYGSPRGGRRERGRDEDWRKPPSEREPQDWRDDRERERPRRPVDEERSWRRDDQDRERGGPRRGREDDRWRGDADRDWRRAELDSGWKERPRGGGRGREQTSPQPPRKKPDKEVDDDGFELVVKRR